MRHVQQLSIPRSCKADSGCVFSALARRILGKLSANFAASFDGKMYKQTFGSYFSRVARPPPPRSIHAQNRRHSSPISLSRTQFLFRLIFCLRGRPTVAVVSLEPPSERVLARRSVMVVVAVVIAVVLGRSIDMCMCKGEHGSKIAAGNGGFELH